MTDPAPAVALLFDDIELGGHLRDALNERGARIVHEGEVSSLSRELLQDDGVDVLVVNLDDSADDALDHLYELIQGDRPRLVFNDAQASRTLLGWDRARADSASGPSMRIARSMFIESAELNGVRYSFCR